MSHEPEIFLVPHTHWDREWYEPFQVFRLRLVEVLDDVVARAEADADFRFTVDGQLAAVEDYLEVRPEQRDRVAALVTRGQLAVGPWQILLDEFLCSGETIVRNLELGWRGAADLGGGMPVGYLPDMFGHCAQMPQILARAGIEHACLWRGVPARVDGHAFRWVAPDGSAVRVEYLWDGYGNAGGLFAFPQRLPEAARTYRAETAARYGDDPVLGMLGGDHSRPRPDLLALARGAGLPLATLAQYVQRFRPDDPALAVVGELRSHARGNILPGVISVRVGLKQAMAHAERMVGEAEALAARWPVAPQPGYARYLELAWRRIVACTAHDSVTGCGVDETAGQVEARLGEAAQLGRAVRDRLLDAAAGVVPSDAYLVVNPSPWPRTLLAELEVPVVDGAAQATASLPDGTPVPVQELGRSDTLLSDETLDADDLGRLLRRIHSRELFGQQVERYSIEPGYVRFEVTQVPRTPSFDKAALGDELAKAARESPGSWRIRTEAQQRRSVLVAVPVAGSGQVAVTVAEGNGAPTPVPDPVVVTERTLDNGQVRVEVDDDGALTVRGADGTVLAGVGRLVDGGDRGDSYNYGPPARDTVVDAPVAVDVAVRERGPVRATLQVEREYEWPVGLSGDVDERADVTVRVPVRTLVSLSAGEPFVRLAVSFVNAAADHRLRLHVPLPEPVSGSAAEGQFAVTTRGLDNEGGWGEHPLPTFPASGFVTAGAATVLLEHATEYEVVGAGAELALTLLRAVGWMSVNVHPLRDEPAGPEIAVPAAQYPGREVTTRLAVLPGRGGWDAMDAPRHGAEFRQPALVRRGAARPGGPVPRPDAGVAVSGAGVAVPSLRPVAGGQVELRLVAMTDAPTTATVTGPFTAARRTDLLGREGEQVPVEAGMFTLPLAGWEIATVRLA